MAAYDGIDMAFNNAGVDKPPAPIADTNVAAFDDQIVTNLRGVFLSMKHELPHLVKFKGALINMGSIGGHHAFPNIIGYAASKAAIIHMTRRCAQEYGHDIRANVIAPGVIATEMLTRVQRDWKVTTEQLVSGYPIKRLGSAGETAAAVLWLASTAASYVSG